MTGRLPTSSTEQKRLSSGSLKHPFEPSLFEPKSPLPGNGIFRPETNGPKRRRSSRRGDRGDKTYSQTPADSGLIAGFGEISVRTRMRGGPGRTRTSNQAVMRQWSAIARPAAESYWDLNKIGVRSFILSGAPLNVCNQSFIST